MKNARSKIEKCLSQEYYYFEREYHYKNVKPRIIAEKYMTDETGIELKDYKIFNFNGCAEFIQVDYDRYKKHKRMLFSIDWVPMDVGFVYPIDLNTSILKPQNLTLMLSLARKLSEGIIHVRTDFYSINDKIYFGELTFYPEGGFGKFIPPEYDLVFGSRLELHDNSNPFPADHTKPL